MPVHLILTKTKRVLVVLMLLSMGYGCSSSHKPAPVVEVKGTAPLSKRVKNSITATEYIVKKGETLYSIAWRSNTDVRHLASTNNIVAPYRIYPGQKIYLSKKAAQTSKNKASAESFQKKEQTVVKKTVASSKKQAYGGSASGQKISKKSSSNSRSTSSFSKKVNQWRWPVKGPVIGTYSSSQQGNKGIDIAGKRGDKIKAAADGQVVYAGDVLRGYGKLIIIKHNDDYLSAYAHNDAILVKEQQIVKVGDVIAKMGDTDSQRVMLHFEVRFRGKSVNPMKYLPKR